MVLSSIERIDMIKAFTIIEKQVFKNGSHFGGQISKDSEVFFIEIITVLVSKLFLTSTVPEVTN